MLQTMELTFEPVGLDDLDRIYPYTSAYGEGSCQHSPVSMFSLSEKYGDMVCIRDGFLYTVRSCLCDEQYRVYLAPLGGGDRKAAFARVLDDAASHGRKAKFVSLTQTAAAFLGEAFPDRFEIAESRDLAEYLCRTESTATFSGGKLIRRRREVHTFWHAYGDRATVMGIEPKDFPEILAFARKWLQSNEEGHDMHALRIEARMIEKQIGNFENLRLSGVVLRIDGEVEGFSYGTKLSAKVFDGLVEKANKEIPHIGKVLRQEATKQCAMDCEYVNMEEDVGIPGLRVLKESYHPEILLRKYIAVER